MICLADIGGTHVRLAVAEAGSSEPARLRKYQVADFDRFEDVLAQYLQEENLGITALLIATAAFEDGAVWRFVNNNKWHIDPALLSARGWPVEVILNDFAAAARGLSVLKEEDRRLLKPGEQTSEPRPSCLIGPGTGLGMAHLVPVRPGEYHVQRTHGGHIPAAALSEDQGLILRVLRQQTNSELISYENLISGPGLFAIYKAGCAIAGTAPKFETSRELFKHLGDSELDNTLRLFHEFFGLFAAGVVMTAHGYGGLYLTGGVLDRIMAADCFKLESFERYFHLPSVDSVRLDLARTPIAYITTPVLTMKGLLACAGQG